MKLSTATLFCGTAAVASASSIRATSKVGRKMLSKARRLDGGDGEAAWLPGYALRFEKCATTTDYYGGYFGGNQNNQNNNNNDRNNFNGMYENRLVHFKLCPEDTCGSGCSGGGDYVMDMTEFVGAYLEYQEEKKEQECEAVENNCDCENANDDEACEVQCYKDAGLYNQCVDQDQDNQNNGNNNGQQQAEEFDLQEAMECRRLDVDEEAAQYYAYGNNNMQNYQYQGQNGQYNYNGQQNQQQQEIEFFVGPFCSKNGKSINLGVFMDETCSFGAPDGVYEKFNYGASLPYSSRSIVSNECISCTAPAENDGNNDENENQNNGNNYNYEQPETLEFCERIYEESGKCEENMNLYGAYPNTMACQFIKGLNAWGKQRIAATFADATASLKTPKVLAGVFAATTVMLGGVAYYMHQKLQRSRVDLVQGGGNVMA